MSQTACDSKYIQDSSNAHPDQLPTALRYRLLLHSRLEAGRLSKILLEMTAPNAPVSAQNRTPLAFQSLFAPAAQQEHTRTFRSTV